MGDHVPLLEPSSMRRAVMWQGLAFARGIGDSAFMSDNPFELVEAIWKNAITRIPVMLALSAGTVIAVAGGFYATYQVVTWVGN